MGSLGVDDGRLPIWRGQHVCDYDRLPDGEVGMLIIRCGFAADPGKNLAGLLDVATGCRSAEPGDDCPHGDDGDAVAGDDVSSVVLARWWSSHTGMCRR